MKSHISAFLSPKEISRGWVWFAVQMLALSGILRLISNLLPFRVSESRLNFLFFLINFLATLILFRRFLLDSFRAVSASPLKFLGIAAVGLAGYFLSAWAVKKIILLFYPVYANRNDAAIAAMAKDSFVLMAVSTVLLVPLAEECIYRGLLFRVLSTGQKRRAYLVSAAAFSAAHILGYVGTGSLPVLVLSFLQYLPAGLWLAWSYDRSDTIYAPILIHSIINCYGIFAMR